MRSSKSRSRNKNNRSRTVGNIVNRVFDSSGPEGKVRGTPQQIIEKYNQLARDAQLAGDRVATENFQQHAEHYTRMLAAAQKEMDARREQQDRENRDRQRERTQQREGAQGGDEGTVDQTQPNTPDDSGLVETPESSAKTPEPGPVTEAPAPAPEGEAPPAKKPRARRTRAKAPAEPKADDSPPEGKKARKKAEGKGDDQPAEKGEDTTPSAAE